MKKENGITLVALTITIVVMMILASITVYFGIDLIKEVKLQDLRTNMLLIQAKAKECVEKVSFQKANVTDTATIEQIKNENLKGKKIAENEEVKALAEQTNKIDTTQIDEYYYLDVADLEEMGIQDLKPEDYGWFIIRYDIDNIKIEVINTTGYQGKYTLEEINALVEE